MSAWAEVMGEVIDQLGKHVPLIRIDSIAW
jgi:hypothetical protein